ncbi:MAG TPA: PilZ domain-containing protein [Candidatus Acidoferrales bacterium]|nr:PilZ domain-containing protein [Candidatus Acidoferrales bacterium]
MDGAKSPYSSEMTSEAATGSFTNKRRFVRTLCRASASVKPTGADINLSCTITDISPAGCYMEMLAPLPVETRVEVTVISPTSNLQCLGIVRHSLSGMGMGVKFDSFTEAQLTKLREIVPEIPDVSASELNPSAPSAPASSAKMSPAPSAAAKPAPAPPPHHPTNAGEVLEAVLRVLLRKGIITRAELTEELEKGKTGKH